MASWSNFVPTFDERSIASRWVTGFASSTAADRFDIYMWTGIIFDNGWRDTRNSNKKHTSRRL
jgi:hypothetical protein